MTKSRKILIDKNNFNRILLTETIPYEVPFIISNEGFYSHCQSYENSKNYRKKVFNLIIDRNEDKYTIPLKYKIRKNIESLRELSLIHPFSQWKFIKFYSNYSEIICYYCSRSKATLRSPVKVGSSFYYKNSSENINKLRKETVDTTDFDNLVKHSSSYFSYSEINKLYKFFDSETFLNLEKKYSSMWFLDILKCFDNIYTHAISWAVKSKKFAKENVLIKSCFDQEFDKLMQRSNYNETNGIAIGPEVSRIFAEIIFQDIDLSIINSLVKVKNIKYGREYVFRRYVDDIFVFATNDKIAKIVTDEVADQLSKYNLYINENKIERYSRPFVTKKSASILEVSKEINLFLEKFTIRQKKDDEHLIIPKKINRLNKLKRNFINNIKSICYITTCDYSLVSNYIIASLFNRIINIIDSYSKEENSDEEFPAIYKDAFLLVLETIFFFYSVNPSVSSSYSLGKSIIFSYKFFEEEISKYELTLKQRILELAIKLLKQDNIDINFSAQDFREGLVPLEKLNVILSISELGEDYLLPLNFIDDLFKFDKSEPSYFELMSCLFYIKNNVEYNSLKDKIILHIKKKLTNLGHLKESADIVYVFLDTITCPFINEEFRIEILKDFYKCLENRGYTDKFFKNEIKFFEANEWFIKWKDIDLINILEKKESNIPY